MLFQFFRPQLQRERPTISATVRREIGRMDMGGIRVERVDDGSNRPAAPVIIVNHRPGGAARKA